MSQDQRPGKMRVVSEPAAPVGATATPATPAVDTAKPAAKKAGKLVPMLLFAFGAAAGGGTIAFVARSGLLG